MTSPPETGSADGVVNRAALSTVANVFRRHQPIQGYLNRELGLDPAPPATVRADDIGATVVHPDRSWRIADATLFDALGWQVGTQVGFTRTATGFTVAAVPDTHPGRCAVIDARRRLMLPRDVRRTLDLLVSQPVLMLADTARGRAELVTIADVTAALQVCA